MVSKLTFVSLLLTQFFPVYSDLKFRPDGTFTILQVADMHVGNGASDPCMDYTDQRSCNGTSTLDLVERAISNIIPDFVVFTGDQIDAHADDAFSALDLAVSPAIDAGLPWSAILGNHDGENSLSRAEVITYLASKPNAHMPNHTGDFVLEVGIHANNSASTPLWFLDSGARYNAETYDWIKPAQLSWMQTTYIDVRNNNSLLNPGLAFWHIPIPEFKHAKLIRGSYQEGVSSSRVNSGLFGTLLLCGVKVGFVGHDHTNDFCGTHFGGVRLCYGGGVGYHTYGKSGWVRRVRIIRLSEWGRNASTWMFLDSDNSSSGNADPISNQSAEHTDMYMYTELFNHDLEMSGAPPRPIFSGERARTIVSMIYAIALTALFGL